jgi:hypothetical protein
MEKRKRKRVRWADGQLSGFGGRSGLDWRMREARSAERKLGADQ